MYEILLVSSGNPPPPPFDLENWQKGVFCVNISQLTSSKHWIGRITVLTRFHWMTAVKNKKVKIYKYELMFTEVFVMSVNYFSRLVSAIVICSFITFFSCFPYTIPYQSDLPTSQFHRIWVNSGTFGLALSLSLANPGISFGLSLACTANRAMVSAFIYFNDCWVPSVVPSLINCQLHTSTLLIQIIFCSASETGYAICLSMPIIRNFWI